MVYSDKGLGEMSRRFHTAIRTRLLPPHWQDMAAPLPGAHQQLGGLLLRF